MSESGVPFGRYLLVEKLGEGGMATVYRAVLSGPHQFQRQLVVKRVHGSHSLDPEFQQMFIEEARLSALLHHPGIVQVQDFGQVQGEYFLAMEFIEGIDLIDLLRSCAEQKTLVPIAVACHVFVEIASALGYAHALCDEAGSPLGIVHRDVSPSNVMITRAGAVKLLDFGVAKISSTFSEREATSAGTLKGKISYMSPEQADGRAIDHRSDIFALGIVLHELLTRSRLFRTRDDLETLRRIREAQVDPPSVKRPEIDAELDAVVVKMLARSLDDRFQSCEEVVAALSPLVHRYRGDMGNTRDFVRSLGEAKKLRSTLLWHAVHGAPAQAVNPSEPPRGEAPGAVTTVIGPVAASPGWSPRTVQLGSGDFAEGSLTHSSGEVIVPPSRPSSRLRIAWIAACAVLVTAIALLVLLPREPEPQGVIPPQRVAASPSEAAPVPPEAPPRRVHLRVDGDRGARVSLDGIDVGRVPLELELRTQADPRRLFVELEGRIPMSQDIAGDRDLVVEATLTPIATELDPPTPLEPPTKRAPSPTPKRRPAVTKKLPEIRDPFGP